MQLTRNLRLAVGALLALHLASAFAAIVLLGRMRPAIERIIDQNVYSLVAVEEMLAVLAEDGSSPGPEPAEDQQGRLRRYRDAYRRAAQNITTPHERPILDRIEELSDGRLPPDEPTRRAVVGQLAQLGEVNRDAIVVANESAQRLGAAGAWAVVFLAVLTLGGALITLRRMDRRVLQPLEELHDVLVGLRSGEVHRRCRARPGAGAELQRAMAALNRFLDDRNEALRTATAAEHAVLTGGDDADRATLLQLLDEEPQAVVVIDGHGEIVASNANALDRLAEDDSGLREALRKLARGAEPPDGVTVQAVDGTERRLCRLPS
jgi:hypothetical protein